MTNQLNGMRVAILVADGFEQVEMTKPKQALEEAGAKTEIVSPAEGEVQGWNHREKGDRFSVGADLNTAREEDYDALLLPGGVMNPDQLRTLPQAVRFVKRFVQAGKPVAAICHGPWLLAEAGVIQGRHLTSWPSIKSDLINAGAHWSDEQVIVDDGLITSRKPDDIPAFNKMMIQEFSEHGAASRGSSARPGVSRAIN
jgi:protease I